jgi:tRNA pseudouridine55 synthase
VKNKVYNDISAMLLFDKPKGITSFKAAHKIKHILNVKKTGHCGTLDPGATGLLIILVGKATKLQDSFMKQDKVYRSSFLLGTTTDSADLDGKITAKCDFSNITVKQIKDCLEKFKGEIEQIPPMFSALKHNGKKLYELAREGIEVERKPRKVIIKALDFLSYDKETGILDVIVECSSGTYIRTLAKDIGEVLGCGATVSGLRREKIGKYDVKDAITYEESENADKLKEKLNILEV